MSMYKFPAAPSGSGMCSVPDGGMSLDLYRFRACIRLAYRPDPALLKLEDPEFIRLFEHVGEAMRKTGEG